MAAHRNPLEGRYDVAVVGGGLTGSSAALALAKKGARVAVLEAETDWPAIPGYFGGLWFCRSSAPTTAQRTS
jgi:2-polyprenyl-6-methoxyphenol hydroxylase-like FAD-dependent oxidoreductase